MCDCPTERLDGILPLIWINMFRLFFYYAGYIRSQVSVDVLTARLWGGGGSRREGERVILLLLTLRSG
jgi:hypothetical protein